MRLPGGTGRLSAEQIRIGGVPGARDALRPYTHRYVDRVLAGASGVLAWDEVLAVARVALAAYCARHGLADIGVANARVHRPVTPDKNGAWPLRLVATGHLFEVSVPAGPPDGVTVLVERLR
jgi:hypothetical protein